MHNEDLIHAVRGATDLNDWKRVRVMVDQKITEIEERRLTVITYAVPDEDMPHVHEVRHGDMSVLGMNILAVPAGYLCAEGECDWCDTVSRRLVSRMPSRNEPEPVVNY